MNKKYQLGFTKKAAKKYKKLTTKNKHLQEKVQEILKILVDDPFHSKVNNPQLKVEGFETLSH